MAFEKQQAPKDYEKGVHDTAFAVSPDRTSSPTTELYNNTLIKQDNGILSKLRRLETRMDHKLGIESEAIDRVSLPCPIDRVVCL